MSLEFFDSVCQDKIVGDKRAYIPVFDGHDWHEFVSSTGCWMNTYKHTYRNTEMLKDLQSLRGIQRAMLRGYSSLT